MTIFRLKYSITFKIPIEAENEEQARKILATKIIHYLHNTCTIDSITTNIEKW